MDDIRVGSVLSYDSYGERQPPGSGKRRRHPKAEVEAEPFAQDFFELSASGPDGAEPVQDYFTPSDRTEPES
jgi:hypothetical protein